MGYFDNLNPTPPADPPKTTTITTADGAEPYALAALRGEAQAVAQAPEGTRNHTLNKAWFNMGRHIGAGTIPPDHVRNALADAARQAGLPQHEIDTVLRDDHTSAMRAGAQHPRVPTITYDARVAEVTAQDLAPEAETVFWGERKILTHIHDAARARMVAPWGVLGATLARALALTPWTVQLPPIVGAAASLNFAVALVAKSGGGKGGADGVAHDAIRMPHVPEYRIGSGEAIAHCLKHKRSAKAGGGEEWNTDGHNALINITEVDKLTAQAQRQGATIMLELRAAWSGEALGHVTADASRRLPVEKNQYRLALILGVQPGRAGGLLDDSDGGFPQRLIWLPAYDTDAPTMNELPDWPAPIIWQPPRVQGLDRTIDVCDTAAREVREARWRANRGEGDPLDGHLLLAREKVAAGLAILDGRYDIDDDDWRLAGIVVAKSNAVREGIRAQLRQASYAANDNAGVAAAERQHALEETLVEKARKRICPKIMRRLGVDWTARKTMRDAWISSRDKRYLDDALEHLIGTGQIEQNPDKPHQFKRIERGEK